MEVHLPPLNCSRTRGNAVRDGKTGLGLNEGRGQVLPHTTPKLGEHHRGHLGGITNMLKAGSLGGHAGLDSLVGGTAEAAKCTQGQILYHGGDLKLGNASSLPR